MKTQKNAHGLCVVVLVGFIGPSAFCDNPVELSVKGAAQVTLGPPEAAIAGAAFSLDGLPFQGSGLVSDLEPGSHPLQLQPLAGWIEPAEQDILIVGGATRDVAFEYTPLQSYYFKGVPPQTAHSGAPLRIVILSSDPGDPASPAPGTKLSFSASPPPAGAISFDPDSGELRYSVDPRDRRDFTVTFRASSTGGPVEGTLVISPAPALLAEEAALHFERPMPDPEAKDYIQIRESKSPTPVTFNWRDNVTTRSVSISGRVLVFESGSQSQDLFARYDGDTEIKELTLYAETIIVRSPLRAPGAHVEIHARELRFEKSGSIDITPLDWIGGKPEPVAADGTTASNGVNGLSSAPMEVYVETFHSDLDPQNPGVPPKRFILRGAGAQDAGEGRDGRNMLRPGTEICGSLGGRPIVYSACITPDGTLDNVCGQETVSGEDAVYAGTPGRGGAGGIFTSPFGVELAPFLDLGVGANGARGADRIGGVIGGTFVTEVWKTDPRTGEPCAVEGHGTVFPVRGASAPAPGVPGWPCNCLELRPKDDATIAEECEAAAQDAVASCVADCDLEPRRCAAACRNAANRVRTECLADPGSFLPLEYCAQLECLEGHGKQIQSPDSGAWLHPLVVRSTLRFVRDAYLNERIPGARGILDEYRILIAALKGNLPPGAEANEYSQLAEEIETLLHRIDANLDYFGNQETWVPLLSFEANLAAFEEEVDRAIPILYLSHWVERAAEKAEGTRDAAIAAKGHLDKEIEVLVVDHAAAEQELPALMAEAEDLDAKAAAITSRLATLASELEKRVQESQKQPFWRKAVGVLGAVAKVVPVYQPALGYVGTGLDLLSKFDPSHPLANVDKLPDLLKAVKSNPYANCAKTKGEETKADPKKEDKPTLVDRLKACAPLLSQGVKEVRNVLKEVQIDKKTLDAELEKLRATDPVFVGPTQELQALNAEKQKLGERLSATLDKLAKFSSAVEEDQLAIEQLDQDLTAALDVLDHRSIAYVADMGKRTTDRLLNFQYLMAKAYQYRTLKPYTGNLHLGRILDRVRDLVEFQSSTPVLSPDQFESLKAIYLDELGRIGADILGDLNVNTPEHSEPVSFRLTAEQLAELNERGSIELDLASMGLFGQGQEDLRIASIKTQELDVTQIGEIGTTATLRLKLEHSGFSRLTREGQTYLFTHYRTERVNPISWSTVYDGLSRTWTETEISAATDSLLRFILKLSGSADILLYSRPSALAKLVLSKEVTADAGVDLRVDGLVLKLQYDYGTANASNRRLAVEVSSDLGPRILLDHQDSNGRQDGLGSFARSFAGPGSVELEAPASHGLWTFDHWELDGIQAGGGAATSRLIEVSLNTDRRALAVYRSTLPPPGELFRRGDSNGDGVMNITDAVSTLAFLFTGGVEPGCKDAADSNDDGALNITDAIFVLGYLFLGAAAPPAPGPSGCGADPTVDDLGPCSFDTCR